jgi:hypothetical protein
MDTNTDEAQKKEEFSSTTTNVVQHESVLEMGEKQPHSSDEER